MTGIVILGVAVVVSVCFGVFRRVTDGRFDADQVSETWAHVHHALPGEHLGERATLVQFSSAFCAPCRTTRVVLADVAQGAHGVRHLEIDAEMHLDLVRALDVRRTPTTLVLDSSGHEVARAAGAPQRGQVLAALPAGASS